MFLEGWALCTSSHAGAKAHVRCVELYVIESVDEVRAELELKPLGQLEVLLQTQVHIGIVRTAEPGELRSAVAESAVGGRW